MSFRLGPTILLLLALEVLAVAQGTGPTTAPNPRTKSKGVSAEPDPVLVQKRMAALSLLTSLADEARSYKDEVLRARVQARIADALWEHDRLRAIDLFRRAWAVADALEASEQVDGSAPGKLAKNPAAKITRTKLRSEILRLAACRDQALGEEFLAKLRAAVEETGTSITPTTSEHQSSSAEQRERFQLANEFLNLNEFERALQFADPALTPVTERAILFLQRVRDQNPVAADERFIRILVRAGADPISDANTVSLLGSYALTPSVFLAVTKTGIPSATTYDPRLPPDLPVNVRQGFFRVSASILLRPLSQIDQTEAGRTGTYYIARRMLPWFQQFSPELAPQIATQVTALAPDAQQTAVAEETVITRGFESESSPVSNIEVELENRLKYAITADDRDRAYVFAAMHAADLGDARALEFVNQVVDTDTRKGVGNFVNYNLISGLLRKKRVDEALRIAEKTELTHVQRTYLLTQAASILNADRARKLALLEESVKEAERIDEATAERAYAFIALMLRLVKVDRLRAWELLNQATKAANAIPDFTGENGMASITLDGKISIRLGVEVAAPDDLADSLHALAEDDFYQAVSLAKAFRGDAPRAVATIATARAVLDTRK
jgi:hypothetical protein